jgi:hypothetical protein
METRDFSVFRNKIKSIRTPIGDRSYQRYSINGYPVRSSFDLDYITKIIEEGDPDQMRELSRYYYRISGLYRSIIDLRASLYTYDTMVTPVYDINKSISKDKAMKVFYKACSFVDELNVPVNFARITREVLVNGQYYGILREEGKTVTIQDLPIAYCRTRFKDLSNLDILEFNLNYFNRISDEDLREEAVAAFPKIVQLAWKKYGKGKSSEKWVEIPASLGGISFYSGDRTPMLIASIPAIYKLSEAIDRESKRDENELYKMLIQQMPIDSKGELVFQLDEVADIHASIAEMLQDNDTIDVLTTFGDTKLESVQDSTSASQSSDRISKYKDNSYDEMGVSSLLFNCDGSASLPYSIKKEEAIMSYLMNQYSAWVRYQINRHYSNSIFSFDFTILPITIYNRNDLQDKYFRGAQYGYSKMYAGVALGIKQTNQLSLMNFENDILDMSMKMVPLQSSYTTSGKDIQTEEKNVNAEDKNNSENDDNEVKRENIKIEGNKGRPEQSLESQSESTVATNESK